MTCVYVFVCVCTYTYGCISVKDFTHVLLQLVNTNSCFLLTTQSRGQDTPVLFSEKINSQLLCATDFFSSS